MKKFANNVVLFHKIGMQGWYKNYRAVIRMNSLNNYQGLSRTNSKKNNSKCIQLNLKNVIKLGFYHRLLLVSRDILIFLFQKFCCFEILNIVLININ